MKEVIKDAPRRTIPHTEMSVEKYYLCFSEGDNGGGGWYKHWSLIVPSSGYDKEVYPALIDNLFTKGNSHMSIKPQKTLKELVDKFSDNTKIFEFDSFFELCEFYIKHDDAIKPKSK